MHVETDEIVPIYEFEAVTRGSAVRCQIPLGLWEYWKGEN